MPSNSRSRSAVSAGSGQSPAGSCRFVAAASGSAVRALRRRGRGARRDARLDQSLSSRIHQPCPGRIARHAPDLRDKIRGIDILTPDDLRARNPNAVSGDPYGGSAELDQSLLWRPLASSGHHATTIGRLWHIGASTHPGAGLGGGSGHLVANTLIKRKTWRR